ncbi:polygalacturonase ADPG2-like isoform X2 [Aegilops tauschii subsp. strangulata]|uniref:polygalacturonase ADPG2-like isoform X2 n=1 Tax=Aegilops tauschii subsp. strangulata TaxID=200361 RepID=UPI001E1CA8A4|nr:polygalacturonase ADPG1-like isoform X2 [Aegilops tauschii subsp. strangulata]
MHYHICPQRSSFQPDINFKRIYIPPRKNILGSNGAWHLTPLTDCGESKDTTTVFARANDLTSPTSMGIISIRTGTLLLAGLAWCGVLVAAAGVFNVKDYAARGHGTTDDTKAFMDAWTAACGARGWSATLLVPAAKSFLVGPTRFSGPCASSRITVQVMGTITAPPARPWSEKNYWLMFYQVHGLTVTGGSTGLLDGRGGTWWGDKCKRHADCIPKAPTALVVMNCADVELSQFSSKNSPQMHIAVCQSSKVHLTQLTITAPWDSPNTDGVHVDRSQDVRVTRSTIGTGDDCVSIGPGSRFVTVDGIVCGPGHGVSVGSLGRKGATESVEYIDVKNVQFINTANGARIKTWQGGKGYAKSISFTDIKFTNVDHPVVINQFYVDRHDVPNMGIFICRRGRWR